MVATISKMRKDMGVIERRITHLAHRVATSASDLTYDRQELGALERIYNILEAIDKKPWVLKELEGEK